MPPNTTSLSQPLDAGIINELKTRYRSKFIKSYDHQYDETTSYKKVNLKNAILLLSEAWSDLTTKSIKNCYLKTGMVDSCKNILTESYNNGTNLKDSINNTIDETYIDLEKKQNRSLIKTSFWGTYKLEYIRSDWKKFTEQDLEHKMLRQDQTENYNELDNIRDVNYRYRTYRLSEETQNLRYFPIYRKWKFNQK